VNHEVPLNNTEIWELRSTSGFGHPFHIHDVEFKILTVNGAAPTAEQSGWKDVVFVPRNQTVRFIARFDDYADAEHPFMYHCHISLHEDEGMMGQFIVTDNSSVVGELSAADFVVYPNPASDRISVNFPGDAIQAYYVKIINAAGKVVMMLPRPQLANGIDISTLSSGLYHFVLTEEGTKRVITRSFVVE